MSRSVSAPSSVTKTSPCWNGFIVPGSTLRYGSSFCMVTLSPRATSKEPRLDAVRPLPKEDTTPPVTKMCLVFSVFPTGLQPICGSALHRWRPTPWRAAVSVTPVRDPAVLDGGPRLGMSAPQSAPTRPPSRGSQSLYEAPNPPTDWEPRLGLGT